MDEVAESWATSVLNSRLIDSSAAESIDTFASLRFMTNSQRRRWPFSFLMHESSYVKKQKYFLIHGDGLIECCFQYDTKMAKNSGSNLNVNGRMSAMFRMKMIKRCETTV